MPAREDVAKGMRQFREHGSAQRCHFFRNFTPEDFARLMAHCACMIGNSSAALREGAFLGMPAVNIGTRQQGREHGPNVVHVARPGRDRRRVAGQIAHGRYERADLFGDGDAGIRIADVLANVRPPVQKRLHYEAASLAVSP